MTAIDKSVICLRHALLGPAGAILAVGIASGQTTPTSSSNNKGGASSITLDGCVAASPDRRKTFTLENAGQETTYVLKGLDVHDFVG